MSDDDRPTQPEQQPRPAAPQQPTPPAPSSAWMPPPMPYAQAPQPKQGSFKRGFGLGSGLGLGLSVSVLVLSIVGGIVSILMLGMAIAALGPASASTATDRYTTVWGDASAPTEKTVRAISISGAIMAEGGGGLLSAGTSGYEVANLIDSLQTTDGKGIVLLIDTPGGTINGSRAIGDAIVRYQKRTNQKVISFVRGMSASGGMYAMAPSDEIIADHGTLIGSIGVIFGPLQRYKDVKATSGTLFEQGVSTTGGITREYLTAGKGKDFGNPFRDMTAEERKVFTDGIAVEYDSFVSWVSEKRNIPETIIRNSLGAYIFDPQTAKQNKLVDQVMGPDEAFRHIATSMGLSPDEMRVVRPAPPSALESLLGAESRIYGQIDAVAPGTVVTNRFCTGGAQVLAFHGSLQSVCG